MSRNGSKEEVSQDETAGHEDLLCHSSWVDVFRVYLLQCKKNYYETKISRLSKNYGFLCFVSDFPSRPDLNNLVFLVSHWSKNQNHGQFDVVMFVRFDRNNRLINLTSYSGKRIKRIET